MPTITYAIGDVHGRLDLLRLLLRHIEADAEAHGAAATIVFTGDYLDRGPDSRGVVATLIAGPQRPGDRFVPLRGNHDQLFVEAVGGGRVVPDWAWTLFSHTVESYGLDGRDLPERHGVPPERAGDLPRHAAFLAALPLTYDDGTHLFVHAGIRPGVPLADQEPHDLMWIRDPFLDYAGPLPRRVVHGHTIIGPRPVVRPNRISIDTGAFRSGILTAAVLDGQAEPRFLQAFGEPDRAAIVREAILTETMAGRPVSSQLRAIFDDFLAGGIDAAEMERRSARLGLAA